MIYLEYRKSLNRTGCQSFGLGRLRHRPVARCFPPTTMKTGIHKRQLWSYIFLWRQEGELLRGYRKVTSTYVNSTRIFAFFHCAAFCRLKWLGWRRVSFLYMIISPYAHKTFWMDIGLRYRAAIRLFRRPSNHFPRVKTHVAYVRETCYPPARFSNFVKDFLAGAHH